MSLGYHSLMMQRFAEGHLARQFSFGSRIVRFALTRVCRTHNFRWTEGTTSNIATPARQESQTERSTACESSKYNRDN